MNTNTISVDALRILLLDITHRWYTHELTAAKRLILGARSLHLPSETYHQLLSEQKNVLRDFHKSLMPLVPYLTKQREIDNRFRDQGGEIGRRDLKYIQTEAAHYNTARGTDKLHVENL